MSNRDAPERIWAHVDTPIAQHKSGSWHESPYGTEYVRADIHEALQAQVAQMREALGSVDDALRRLPDGEWETWTSCSFRRISRVHGGDGDVLHATVHKYDGHPDLSWDEDQCDALCQLVNTLRAASKESDT